jgi:DNA repair protein RecN (Recombination protein N)
MLKSLFLTDFVIVRQLELEFGPGFTVLTGETGAGKSVLLDAIGLLLGGRSDPTLVREGCKRTEIHGVFLPNQTAFEWLCEHGLETATTHQGTEVILRRTLDSEGKSRAFINDRPTTLQALRELGDLLLDIHGQHASLWLSKPSLQRRLLDDFGQLNPYLEALHPLWLQRQASAERLARALQAQSQDEEKRERLTWVLEELKALRPEDNEWDELSKQHKRLSHAASLMQGTQIAVEALSDREQSICAELDQLAARLAQLSEHDQALRAPSELLTQASIQLNEASADLSRYMDRSDLDPHQLGELDERLSALHAASRKYRIQPEQLPEFWRQQQSAFADLEAASNLPTLKLLAQEAEAKFQAKAKALRKERQKFAKQLSEQVSQRLQGLGMAGAAFGVAFREQTASSFGIDEIEFQISAHSTTSAKPLAKIASGGELSRVSLALAVVAAQANPVPTLIFDEADAGVGGAVAELIGQLMRELGAARQVLCVTHLPQVAALANEHYLVSKTSDKNGVQSQIELLNKKDRVEEIARMLGGIEVTLTTRKHAQELIRRV